ncbi:MAG: glycerol-3-phosphate 1-O-acyltransferase PlsY [Gammaproteobacteria bacterium]
MWQLLTFFLIFAYLLGSISSAVVVCKFMHLPDPRTLGSGNPGATNVLRVGGKQAALIVLFLDMLKGFIPVFFACLTDIPHFALGFIGFAAVLGHIYPIFFRFQGGKGIATFLGAILALSFWLGLWAILIWMVVALITRYSSLASIITAFGATVISPWATGYFSDFVPVALMAILLIWRHIDNIARLIEGTESKIGKLLEQ